MEPHITELISGLRAQVLNTSIQTKNLLDNIEFKGEQSFSGQHSEMKENIMLAYRHLEDARMRLGKIVQAYNGGKSCYPK